MKSKQAIISALMLLLPGAIALGSQYGRVSSAFVRPAASTGSQLGDERAFGTHPQDKVFLYAHLGEADRDGGLADVGVTIATRFATDGDYRYDRCHTVALVADRERVSVAESSWSGERNARGVGRELVYARIAPDALKTLAAAERVEYEICNSKVAIEPEQLEQLRELSQYVTAATAVVGDGREM